MSTAKKIQKFTVDGYYEEIKNYDKLTELRNGEIVDLASPSRIHQQIVTQVSWWINSYIKSNNGKCEVYVSPMDVKIDDDNIVMPDVFIACEPENFDNQKYNGSPDFIIEIVSTNWADDYCRKLNLYQQSGVREYWIVDPKKSIVTVYFFEEQISERYTFDDDIPVHIYDGKLKINITELLK